MEDDDPVVQEIPVFLSQALANNLYIYQYPVRPANKEWKDVKVVNASIKPKNQLVRVEVGLDTYSDKYCPSKGEQIAYNTDGNPESSRYNKDKDRERSQYFRSGIMDKIVFESSTPCTDTRHYAVAILQDKELHCTPTKGIIQMRPSCTFYDKQDKRKHDKSKTESDDEDKEPEAQQVTVKFARQETEVAKKAREKSFETISQRIAEEPWYDALWKHADTDYAELERLKLFSASAGAGCALAARGAEYVRALVPAPPAHEAGAAPPPGPPLQQLHELLNNAKLMTFTDLRSMIRAEGPEGGGGGELSAAALLSLLSGAACCVRGVWAPRSAALYPAGAAAPLLRAARDHVLYLFTQHSYIDRRKVTAAVRLPPQDVLEIIQSVAKYNPKTGWELLIPPDVAFETKYPEVMQRQNLYWEARQRLFNEMLMGETAPKRQRKKSQRDSIGSDSLMSPKARCNSVSEEDGDRKRKNKSVSGGKRTRNVSSSSAHDGT